MGEKERNLVRTLVLNALADTVDEGKPILEDEKSHIVVRDAFREATTTAKRKTIQDAFAAVESSSDDEHAVDGLEYEKGLVNVVDAVVDELLKREIRISIDHIAQLSLNARDARLYTFITTRDRAAIRMCDIPRAVETPILDGVDYATEGMFDRAAAAFECGIDAATDGEGDVITRVLAGWAKHCSGEDTRAMDFVEEALHIHRGCWSATCVGLAADHRRPAKFREGKLGVRVFFRRSIPDISDRTFTTAVGNPKDSETAWTQLGGSSECMPIEHLMPETRVRLRLEGGLTELTPLHGYYVALGVVDLEVNEIRNIERVFLTGPQTTVSDETIRFARN